MNRNSEKDGSRKPIVTTNKQIGVRRGAKSVQHCVDAEPMAGTNVKAQNAKSAADAQPSQQNALSVRGALAPSGQRWIGVAQDDRSAWIPWREFSGHAMLAVERLSNKDIVLIGHGTKRRLLGIVNAITDFPDFVLAEHSGWVGNQFVLPDGQVFSPVGGSPAEVVFAVDPMKCHRAGTAVGWRRHVAEPLSAFDLPSFLLMLPFAAPLLALTDRADNIGFELVGVRGRGKSTLQALVASAVGAPSLPLPYWISLDTTLAGLELQMTIHNDLPLIMDEANLYLSNTTEGGEARHMRRLAFKLANGHTTARHGDKQRSTGSRYVTLISTNESIHTVTAAARGEGFRAAADRLITLTMPDRPGGAIDRTPKGFNNTGAFMDAVKAAAMANHGVAMPRFVQRLVEHRHRDEAELRQMIATSLADFRRAAGVDENDGSARRVADAFGLIAIAGQAAVEYRVLPCSFRCTEVALTCYHANRRKAA